MTFELQSEAVDVPPRRWRDTENSQVLNGFANKRDVQVPVVALELSLAFSICRFRYDWFECPKEFREDEIAKIVFESSSFVFKSRGDVKPVNAIAMVWREVAVGVFLVTSRCNGDLCGAEMFRRNWKAQFVLGHPIRKWHADPPSGTATLEAKLLISWKLLPYTGSDA